MSKYDFTENDGVSSTKRMDAAYLQPTSSKSYDPFEELAYAIIYNQIIDLNKKLKEAKRKGENALENSQVMVIRRFFYSSWFNELCCDNLHGPTIFQRALDNFEQNGSVFKDGMPYSREEDSK